MKLGKRIAKQRIRRAYRVRNRIRAAGRPRLTVFRSNKHIYAQIIDDSQGRTLVSASTAEKARMAQELGADWVHDRSADPQWSRAVYRATARQGVDVVVDNVGQETWPDSLRCLALGGRLLTVGGSTGYQATVPVNLMWGFSV